MTAVLRSVLSVSAATVLSRATGYVRIAVQGAVLATGVVAEAYALAVLLPGLIYELFLGGILYSIFIPVLVDRITGHGEEDARRLTNALLTLVLPLMALLSVLGIVFAGPLVALVLGLSPSTDVPPADVRETTELAVFFFRVFAVQMLFYGVTTVATGVLQAHRRFFLPTFAPVLNNLIIIGSFIVAYFFLEGGDRGLALYVLAFGATVGVAVMALALVPTLLALGYRPRPQFGHPALLPTAKLAGPMVVLVAASVAFQLLAASLATDFERYAELTYAFTVFSLPYGVFVVAIATALMPELSEKHSREDVEGYRETLSFGLRTMTFVVVPSTVGLIVLAEPIVGLLYQREKFDAQDTRIVAGLLVAYAVGLLGYSAYFFLVRAFYSRQNTITPAILNVGILIAYAALAYGLSSLFGAVGVVLALSIAYAALALLALVTTRREIGGIDGRRLLISLAKMLAAGAVMYTVALAGTTLLGTGTNFTERLLIFVAVGTVSLAAYLAAAFLLRTEELRSVATLLRRRAAE